ncbi:MAG: FixH family protein [Agriterribacter sp.]
MNWGHKLTIVILVFVSWMAYMVYRCATTDFQLVEKEYYKNELRYQQVIDGTSRANKLSSQATVTRQHDKVIVQLPEEMKDRAVEGKLWFYCAYDAALDKNMQLEVNSRGEQVLDASAFEPGNYIVKIEWMCNDISYFTQQKLSL